MATKKPGTAVVSWQERLAAAAQEDVKSVEGIGAGGNFLSFKGGLSYKGNKIPGGVLDIIIVDNIYENSYYKGKFDSDNPGSPVCYAFGRDEKNLAPHPNSSEPQHTTCKGCPQNEFGSADNGKAKACKNTVRIAILPAKPLEAEALRAAEFAYIKPPVTSVKNFASYVRAVAVTEKRPVMSVVTTLSRTEDEKTQFKVSFNKAINIDDDEILTVLEQRREASHETIEFPYPEPREEEAPKPKAKKKY